MKKFKRTAGLACAVSAASIGTACASEDLLLELSETPLTAYELGEARGGFSGGGFEFNFSIVIEPVQISHPFENGGPLPEGGVFGESGGPLPEGGVFGDQDGPLPEGGVFGGNNGPLAPENAAAASTSAAASQPSVQIANNALPEQASSAAVSSAPVASATASSPAAASSVASTAPQSVSVSPPAHVAAAPDEAGKTNAASVAQSSAASPQAAELPNPAQTSVADAPAPPSETSGVDTMRANSQPLEVSPQAVAANDNEKPEEAPAQHSLSFTMVPVAASQRLQTVLTNTVDGAVISRQITMNISVSNYVFQTGMARSASSLTRAMTQQVFLRGLN